MPGLQRRLSDLASGEALSHLRYVPRAVRRVRNWPQFLLTYTRLLNRNGVYELRDGTRIAADPVGVSTIAVVFVKEDYGASVEGPTVVDIGANIGAFSLLAARTPGTRVYAYEPVAETFAQLRANVERNQLSDRVHVDSLAVAGERGERRIAISPHGSPFATLYGGEDANSQPVRAVTLEDVFSDNAIERCDTLKLDCEGAEFEILYAAPADVLARIGTIRLEYHEQDRPRHTWTELAAHLREHGFEIVQEGPRIANTGTVTLRRH